MLAYQGILLGRSAAQTIPDAIETLVEWDAEIHDLGLYHDASLQPTQIIIPVDLGGTYSIYGMVNWTSNGVGIRWSQLLVNGTVIMEVTQPAVAGGIISQYISVSYILAEGDIVTFKVYQNSTGGLDITRDIYTPRFGIDLMGV